MSELYRCFDGGIRQVYRRDWAARARRNVKRCCWCGRKISQRHQKIEHRATKDHVVPKCRGGTDSCLNIKISCEWCNAARGSVDHCVVTLVCIKAIVGTNLSRIARYYNQSVKQEALSAPPSVSTPGVPQSSRGETPSDTGAAAMAPRRRTRSGSATAGSRSPHQPPSTADAL